MPNCDCDMDVEGEYEVAVVAVAVVEGVEDTTGLGGVRGGGKGM